jgi:V8-like Glu-specific endopeptidase
MAAKLHRLVRPAMLLVVSMMVLVATALPTEAQDNPPASDAGAAKDKAENVVSSPDFVSRTEVQNAASNYWTKARMENAEPATPVVPGASEASPSAGGDLRGDPENAPRPEGPAKTIPGSLPEQGSQANSAQLQSTASGTATARNAGYTYYADYVPSNYTTSYPYITFGKVFFTTADGRDQVCSGTVVNSDNQSLVWTAGHCVHGGPGGTWHHNWAFAPAYQNGKTPFGLWETDDLWTTHGWINSNYQNFSQDLGAAVVPPDSDGNTLVSTVGALGIAWNQPFEQDWLAIGYPATAPFDGQRMYYCESQTALYDDSWSDGYTMGIGCDANGGASGGGWTIGLSEDGGTVASVNSYTSPDFPDMMWGPYQGDTAADLYNSAGS